MGKSANYRRKTPDLKKLIEPMSEERLAVVQFSEEVENQIETVQLLERVALYRPQTGMALEILTTTRDFLGLLVELLILRRAFQLSPRRAIEGDDGVAGILGVTKATVHQRLKSLGLKSEDIRDQRAGVGGLIKLSEPLNELAKRLAFLRNKYHSEIEDLPIAPKG